MIKKYSNFINEAEDVKSSIKKTIEKYYTVNKTSNGWVK